MIKLRKPLRFMG